VDKPEAVSTHASYAVKRCEGDPMKLGENLENIANHYSGIHTKSDPDSCYHVLGYEPSKITLHEKAATMLKDAITKSTIYKHPQDDIMGKDTFHVESFNNVLNVFTDKWTVFGTDKYKRRCSLAVCHWNENCLRPFTSTSNPTDSSLCITC